MMEAEIEKTARAVRACGDAALLDRIADRTESYKEGLLSHAPEKFRGGLKTERTEGVRRLEEMKLVSYRRGHAIATGRGFSISTRLIVMKTQGR